MSILPMVFLAVTQTLGLPQGLLDSICFVESGHKVKAIHYNDGLGDSLGVCQIKLATAKSLGFKGSAKNLLEPKTNVYWAGVYLSKQLKRYHGNIEKAIAAYNSGTHRVNSQGLTMNRKYVNKVFQTWIAGR